MAKAMKLIIKKSGGIKQTLKNLVKGAITAKKPSLGKAIKGAMVGGVIGTVPGAKMFNRRSQMLKEAMAYKKSPKKYKKGKKK